MFSHICTDIVLLCDWNATWIKYFAARNCKLKYTGRSPKYCDIKNRNYSMNGNNTSKYICSDCEISRRTPNLICLLCTCVLKFIAPSSCRLDCLLLKCHSLEDLHGANILEIKEKIRSVVDYIFQVFRLLSFMYLSQWTILFWYYFFSYSQKLHAQKIFSSSCTPKSAMNNKG